MAGTTLGSACRVSDWPLSFLREQLFFFL
ncbi:hypothetical protein MARHY0639 [Marinobacter nauticus ATCC 49840]|nr:hypothetical protein MARHY0639 [Marinobacter nauticus ATCC 49840]